MKRHDMTVITWSFLRLPCLKLRLPPCCPPCPAGRHLFEQCVCGELAGRTRVLVTHQLQYAEAADVIVVVDGGRIVHRGTYDELQSR